MPRIAAIWPVVLLFAGCSLPLWDRTERIALATLKGEGHPFDEEVFGAAMKARFPPGAPVDELRAFVKRMKGECHPNEGERERIRCELPVRGGICWAQLLRIDVAVENDAIKSLEVRADGASC